jgi:hypothetical protein
MTPDRSAKIKSVIRVASGNHDYRIVLHYNGVHTDLRSSSASAYKSEQPHGYIVRGRVEWFLAAQYGVALGSYWAAAAAYCLHASGPS